MLERNEELFVNIEGIEFILDTGAQVSSTTEPIKYTDNILVQTYNGRTEEEQMGEKFGIKMIKGEENLLAGRDLKKNLRLKEVDIEKELSRIKGKMIGSEKSKEELIKALREAPCGKFKNDCGKVSDKYAHEIIGGTHKPQRQYPINKLAKKELDQTIQELLEQGVIREITTAITNSPIQLVQKPDLSFRLVSNFRALNRLTKPDRRYIINARDTIERIRNGAYISKLDLCNGFWAIPLKEESQEKTAFTVKNKSFVYQRLPQGYINSSIIFQMTMMDILGDLPVEIYIDDLLIVSQSEKEHVDTVKKVLKRIEEAGLKINIKKSEIMTDLVEFLGFWVSAGNRGITQTMKERITEIKTPNNLKDVQKMMGLMNYVRDIIPKFSQKAKTIYATIKGNKLSWTEEAEKALCELKESILSSGQLEGRNDEK